MTGWIVAALLLGGLVSGAALVWFRLVRPARQLEKVARELVANPPPAGLLDPIGATQRHLLELFRQVESNREELANEAFHLQAILAGMQEGVLVVGPDHRILLANAAIPRMFHLPDSPVGRTVMEALRSHELDRIVGDALGGGAQSDQEVVLQEDPRGLQPAFVTWVNAAVLPGRKGGVRGAVVVLHDVSRLRELEQVRRDFVANTSHELRTPLAIFSGYVENMLDSGGMDWEDVRKTLLVLQRHAERLNFLCNDLLTLTRLESGTMRLNRAPVHAHSLLEAIVQEMTESNTTRGLPVDVSIADNLPVLNVDPTRIEQVFYNLLGNAAKYSPPDGRIRIAVTHDGAAHEALFSVEDSGPGIPAAHLPHIFERFYRVEKSRAREKGGTGLGLSIVKHILMAHGGRVWAESEPGRGTRICFALPTD